ncbi:MAG: site-2 protease family protein [Deltaproteobacteria bacterium]|nr:site-2 protease family protein [Deltaproteobacteria bacterium]
MTAPEHRPCPGCTRDVPRAFLVCPYCHALMHRESLQALTREAEDLTARGDPAGALTRWREALTLLPPASRQHAEVQRRADALTRALDASSTTPGAGATSPAGLSGGKKGLAGALAVAGLFLLKFKGLALLVLSQGKLLLLGLFKLPTLLSMLLWFGVTSDQGWGFALGILFSLYIHEMGHVLALTRRGFPATAPMFIPGLGALVRLQQRPANAIEDARIGLAGPLFGLGAAAVALALSYVLHSPTALAVASLGGSINLFNLLPVWQLDGARGLRPLSRSQRWTVAAALLVSALLGRSVMCWAVCALFVERALRDTPDPDGDPVALRQWLVLVPTLTLLASLTR